MVKSQTRGTNPLLVVVIVGVLGTVGVAGWNKLDTKKADTPRYPSSSKPTATDNPDRLVLTLRWNKHMWGGTGKGTFGLGPMGEEEVELSLLRQGVEERHVENPLGRGATDYFVHAWNPTEGLMMCEIRYHSPEGLDYLITAGHTNFGGNKMDPKANVICTASVADVKAITAKGK
jgi:hypothetical protein